MSAVKSYFKEETKWEMLGLEHPKPADFYISVWQKTRSAVPLLIFRVFLFLLSLGIVLASVTLYILAGIFQYWFIYLTHWGLLMLLFSTGFSVAVSTRVYFFGPISAEFSLPWYVKTYWVLYNIAHPLAFLITIFYWSILYEAGVEEELNHGLDICVHGLNSLVVVLLLMSAGHPSRLFHIHHPIMFGLSWTIFSVIYYVAGGTDTKGNPYVYSVVNWSRPGVALGVLAMTAFMLVALHLLTLGLSSLRDFLAAHWCNAGVISHVEEGTPLRQTQTHSH